MRFSRVLISTVVGSLAFMSGASAWDLAIVTGFNYSHPSLNPDPPNGGAVSAKAAFDFGALTSIPLSDDYFIETGLIRHARDTVIEDTLAATETRYSSWLIPMTFGFMRAKFLGFGFGPYVAVLSARTKTTAAYRAGGTSDFNTDDPNRKSYEVGLNVNLRIVVPVYHESKVVVQGTYLFGFTDLNKSATATDKTQDLLVLVGFQIPIGGSSPSETKDATATSTLTPPSAPTTLSNSSPSPEPSPTPTPKKKKKEKKK